MTIAPYTTLAALIDNYDYFLIDQFGVLRDDEGAYDGAIAALRVLKEHGKHVIVLSNSGRSGQYNTERFVRLGFEPSLFEHFVTSGDVAFEILSASPEIRRGMKAFTISSGGDHDLADRLGLASVSRSYEADLIIISGSEAEKIGLDDYRRQLAPAATRRAPCFCTNPDIHKLAGGKTAPGAGAIAGIYEELGGRVRRIGKPYRDIYMRAISRWRNAEPGRIICIGDSLEHDIKGASDMGLPSVLVRTGILATASEGELAELARRHHTAPTYLMPCFSADAA